MKSNEGWSVGEAPAVERGQDFGDRGGIGAELALGNFQAVEQPLQRFGRWHGDNRSLQLCQRDSLKRVFRRTVCYYD